MLQPTNPSLNEAIRLLSAIADVFGGHNAGFSLHVANVAARFTAHRGADARAIAAAYHAAALHAGGAIRVVVPRDATPRDAEIARWDDPPAGARMVAQIGLPPATADAVRWHRESFDGTGFPDRLRWDGIPDAAMTINVARAFVLALEDQAASGGSAADAVFMLVAASGTIFALRTMREFRAFLASSPQTFDAPFEPEWDFPDIDARTVIVNVCADIDARQRRTAGRGGRLERIVRSIATQLGDPTIDADRAAFAGRLTAIARVGSDGGADDAFTLSRLGLESRAAQAAAAARLLAATPGFGEFADIVGSTEEWFDGSGLPGRRSGSQIDPLARRLAVALAAEAVTATDARRRIEAAAGTRLDPAIVAAYLAAQVTR